MSKEKEVIVDLLKKEGITAKTKHHSYTYLYNKFIEVAQSIQDLEINKNKENG